MAPLPRTQELAGTPHSIHLAPRKVHPTFVARGAVDEGGPELHPATAARLARAEAGQDVARQLSVATLEPGVFGVLRCTIVQVHPILPYNRKAGGEGLRGRIRVADGTGEVDIVLWDDETQHVRSGAFVAGAGLVLAGATVKPGFRGGLELGLRGASWSVVSPAPPGLVPSGGASR